MSYMEDILHQAGLNQPQANTYLYILANGESTPPEIAESLAFTRSNAYKVLERLLEMKLVNRFEVKGKFVYRAEDPLRLSQIVIAERSRLQLLEASLRSVVQELRQQYQRTNSSNEVQTYVGETSVAALRQTCAANDQPSYAINSQSKATTEHIYKLDLTLAQYSVPVEWIVSGNDLLIINLQPDISAIQIKNNAIAQAFQDLWHIIKAKT